MSKQTKSIGDFGENLVALCIWKIFGENSIVLRTGSDNYPFDLIVYPEKIEFKKPLAISVKTRVVRGYLPTDMPLPKNFEIIDKYGFEKWTASVIYSVIEHKMFFGVYMLPLNEITEEFIVKRKVKHYYVKPYIKRAKELNYFFESDKLPSELYLKKKTGE